MAGLLLQVGDLQRLALRGPRARCRHRRCGSCRSLIAAIKLFIHAVGGAQLEFLLSARR